MFQKASFAILHDASTRTSEKAVQRNLNRGCPFERQRPGFEPGRACGKPFCLLSLRLPWNCHCSRRGQRQRKRAETRFGLERICIHVICTKRHARAECGTGPSHPCHGRPLPPISAQGPTQHGPGRLRPRPGKDTTNLDLSATAVETATAEAVVLHIADLAPLELPQLQHTERQSRRRTSAEWRDQHHASIE